MTLMIYVPLDVKLHKYNQQEDSVCFAEFIYKFCLKKQQNKKKILEKNDKLYVFQFETFIFKYNDYTNTFLSFFFNFLRENKKERMQFIGALANEKT